MQNKDQYRYRNMTFYSQGRPTTAWQPAVSMSRVPGRKANKRFVFLAIFVALIGGFFVVHRLIATAPVASTTTKQSASTPKNTQQAPVASAKPASKAAVTTSMCSGNSLSTFVLVSVTKQHLWACNGGQQVYDSAVVTGDTQVAATLTPPGTYHIYGKSRNLHLKGSDANGSWDDPVSYWMPWLNNQYGTYGFHDATWRADSAFGNIDPATPDASHGCVELPLATAAWLYNWAQIGTTVTVEA